MSVFSSFIAGQLIKALEEEFNNHSGEMQSLIIKEIELFMQECTLWLENKINSKKSEPLGNQ